jgi:hypothetical protein
MLELRIKVKLELSYTMIIGFSALMAAAKVIHEIDGAILVKWNS